MHTISFWEDATFGDFYWWSLIEAAYDILCWQLVMRLSEANKMVTTKSLVLIITEVC